MRFIYGQLLKFGSTNSNPHEILPIAFIDFQLHEVRETEQLDIEEGSLRIKSISISSSVSVLQLNKQRGKTNDDSKSLRPRYTSLTRATKNKNPFHKIHEELSFWGIPSIKGEVGRGFPQI
uniref:Uncharacterized protein n=1 Tax=Salix viminalis TaxID=40686 RepID=A0A6N2NKW6_SALVM